MHVQSKGEHALEERTSAPTPLDVVIGVENARMRLCVKKNVLCKAARIKPEMYSYVLKRGRLGMSLPADCMEKIWKALEKLEAEALERLKLEVRAKKRESK